MTFHRTRGGLPGGLARRPGYGLTHVMLLSGTGPQRDQVARELHATGPAASGAYLRIDCRTELERFRSATAACISYLEREPGAPPPLGGSTGTLFLDSVERLSSEGQGLLSALVERLAESFSEGERRPSVRLIVGSPVDLEREAAAGRFLPQLFDALDKVRLDLSLSGGRAGTAGSKKI